VQCISRKSKLAYAIVTDLGFVGHRFEPNSSPMMAIAALLIVVGLFVFFAVLVRQV
jgi:hypothetical protein